MSVRAIAVVFVAVLAAAACSHTETRTVLVPTPAGDSCTYYGYEPGTQAYAICVDRERAARARGRVAATYAYDSLVADSREACMSYGLSPGSERFDVCVRREIDYRRPA